MQIRKQIKKIILNYTPYRIKLLLYSWFSSDLGMSNDMFECILNLKRQGFKPDIILDIGAYKGDWTIRTLKIFEDAKYLMVEPQKSREHELYNLVVRNKNVLYKQVLLGERKKENVKFFEMDSGSSIYEEQSAYPRMIKYLQMTTLNDLISEFELKGKYFLKMDVQGAELNVLKGASILLKDIEFILVEVSLLSYNKGAPQFADIVSFLNSSNFVLFDICNQYRKPDRTLFQMDLLFANKNSLIREKVEFKMND